MQSKNAQLNTYASVEYEMQNENARNLIISFTDNGAWNKRLARGYSLLSQ